jgi:peptidoglycan-associated lipoprotein
MRAFLISLTALLLAAGCANNRATNPDVAPSQQAALTAPGTGWSVPPGQKPNQVTTPQVATPQAAQPAVDEAAVAAAEQAKRDDAARSAREQMHLQQTPPAQQPAATSEPASQPLVAPLVPAFPARMQEQRVLSLQTVHFGFDNWDLTLPARAELDANAAWMKANPEVRVQIGGHADERGTPEYNLALGERRATRVRDYLIEHGVPADNLVTVSYGEEMPVAGGHDEKSWAENRRAEFARAETRQVSGN